MLFGNSFIYCTLYSCTRFQIDGSIKPELDFSSLFTMATSEINLAINTMPIEFDSPETPPLYKQGCFAEESSPLERRTRERVKVSGQKGALNGANLLKQKRITTIGRLGEGAKVKWEKKYVGEERIVTVSQYLGLMKSNLKSSTSTCRKDVEDGTEHPSLLCTSSNELP
ncbi:hypothetical protein CEXT_513411 [Caerostris extrusa]|uniref:Uncharacterized protein n=1 Tax=Caerostris extrusa TaxID=172846 RepID=A0AAV4SHP4_CAEEX|nr:hypothetical protein CEXT_513411 [Caerostris extrusa]